MLGQEEPTDRDRYEVGEERPYESKTYKELVDLRVKEACIRAERDQLLEDAQAVSDSNVQISVLGDKLKQIQETSTAEINGLRALLEKKAQEVGISKQKLEEAIANQVTKEQIDATFAKHQEELVKAVGDAKSEARSELLQEYFDRRLAGNGLQVDENSRALLESCRNLEDVDSLMDKLIGVARRSALHSTPLTEVKVHRAKPIDPEQEKVDKAVGGLMKRLG
jgi:hypothetical protein